MRFMFDTDEAFSYETLRAVAYTVYGGADIGEVMATAARITPGDPESWYREWRALADRTATIAEKCAADGHTASASSAYLRASNYYRSAEFFLRDDPANDPRVADTSARAIEAFRAAPEIQAQWTRVRIPYEGIELEGYYLNSSGDEPGRTLLAHGGYDSTVEELFFTVGEAARRRGWNCRAGQIRRLISEKHWCRTRCTRRAAKVFPRQRSRRNHPAGRHLRLVRHIPQITTGAAG